MGALSGLENILVASLTWIKLVVERYESNLPAHIIESGRNIVNFAETRLSEPLIDSIDIDPKISSVIDEEFFNLLENK